MRISDITDKFARRTTCSGALMRSRYDRETKTQQLTYRVSGNPIADIFDYKSPNDFRLRIHPYARYDGRNSHNNRLYAVLQSVQKTIGDDGRIDWDFFRYSTYIRYAIKLWDRKLSVEYELRNNPMEFHFLNGRLNLDYNHLESFALPNQPTTVPVAVSENSNLTSVTNELNAILAGV